MAAAGPAGLAPISHPGIASRSTAPLLLLIALVGLYAPEDQGMMPATSVRTIADLIDDGYRGLRIPRCTACRAMSWKTWEQLDAKAKEDVLAVAQRFHCGKCDEIPAGLPIVLSTGR